MKCFLYVVVIDQCQVKSIIHYDNQLGLSNMQVKSREMELMAASSNMSADTAHMMFGSGGIAKTKN